MLSLRPSLSKIIFLSLVLSSLFSYSQFTQRPDSLRHELKQFGQNPPKSAILLPDSIKSVTDTISITLDTAIAIFIKNNYAMLAAKYNVDAQYALIRQAFLLNNPNLYFEPSFYNKYYQNADGTTGKFFPLKTGGPGNPANDGDFAFNMNWTISVARKRVKTGNVAKLNAEVAKYQFDDLMRGLIFALRQDFIDLHFGLESLKIFDEEIASVKNIVAGFEIQYQKGNISVRDLTRVRAMLLNLQSNRLDFWNALQTNSAIEFKQLLNNPKNVYYKPILNEADLDSKYKLSSVALPDLVSQALANRPDLKADETQLASDEENVKLQKAVGVPDITVQPGLTRNSNYIQNDPTLGFGIPINLVNRNQGAIQSSKLTLISDIEQVRQDQVKVQSDVIASYQQILELQKSNRTATDNDKFAQEFHKLLEGAEENFRKKNLSLLDFVDIYDSYQQAMVQAYSIRDQYYSAFELLNFNVGKIIFK